MPFLIAKTEIWIIGFKSLVNPGLIYYTTTCFHPQVIFFTNQLTIHSLYLVFFKFIILKL